MNKRMNERTIVLHRKEKCLFVEFREMTQKQIIHLQQECLRNAEDKRNFCSLGGFPMSASKDEEKSIPDSC